MVTAASRPVSAPFLPGQVLRDEDEPPFINASKAPARWAANLSAASVSPLGMLRRCLQYRSKISNTARLSTRDAHCLKLRSSMAPTRNKMAGRGLRTSSPRRLWITPFGRARHPPSPGFFGQREGLVVDRSKRRPFQCSATLNNYRRDGRSSRALLAAWP